MNKERNFSWIDRKIHQLLFTQVQFVFFWTFGLETSDLRKE